MIARAGARGDAGQSIGQEFDGLQGYIGGKGKGITTIGYSPIEKRAAPTKGAVQILAIIIVAIGVVEEIVEFDIACQRRAAWNRGSQFETGRQEIQVFAEQMHAFRLAGVNAVVGNAVQEVISDYKGIAPVRPPERMGASGMETNIHRGLGEVRCSAVSRSIGVFDNNPEIINLFPAAQPKVDDAIVDYSKGVLFIRQSAIGFEVGLFGKGIVAVEAPSRQAAPIRAAVDAPGPITGFQGRTFPYYLYYFRSIEDNFSAYLILIGKIVIEAEIDRLMSCGGIEFFSDNHQFGIRRTGNWQEIGVPKRRRSRLQECGGQPCN